MVNLNHINREMGSPSTAIGSKFMPACLFSEASSITLKKRLNALFKAYDTSSSPTSKAEALKHFRQIFSKHVSPLIPKGQNSQSLIDKMLYTFLRQQVMQNEPTAAKPHRLIAMLPTALLPDPTPTSVGRAQLLKDTKPTNILLPTGLALTAATALYLFASRNGQASSNSNLGSTTPTSTQPPYSIEAIEAIIVLATLSTVFTCLYFLMPSKKNLMPSKKMDAPEIQALREKLTKHNFLLPQEKLNDLNSQLNMVNLIKNQPNKKFNTTTWSSIEKSCAERLKNIEEEIAEVEGRLAAARRTNG